MEKAAAEQLKKYLEAATGEEFSVAHESVAPQGKKIYLGKTNAFLSLGIELDEEELNGDGFVLVSDGKTLYIAGATDKGTLYGVYYYLEEYVGVRFYGLDCEEVPSVSALTFPIGQVTEVPAFKYRGVLSDATGHLVAEHGKTAQSMAELYVKQRQSHEFLADEVQTVINGSFGGSVKINAQINQAHNNLTYVPTASYYADYPSMFYTREGESAPVDICYSSGIAEDGSIENGVNAASAYVAGLKTQILQNPSAEYHMLGQQDVKDYCACAACVSGMQVYGYGSYAGVVLRFYNAVANAIAAWETAEGRTPVKLVCYAYLFSAKAPVKASGNSYVCHETVKLASNLTLRFADLYANPYFSLLDEKQSGDIYGADYFEKWSCVLGGGDSWYWGYATNHSYYFAYTPSLQKVKKTLEGLQGLGAEYVFFQHSTSEYYDWRAMLETYVISKLLWDPTEDIEGLKEEYLNGYYGVAAEQAKAFVANFDAHMASIAETTPRYFAYDIMSKSDETFQVEELVPLAFLESQLALLDEATASIEASSLSEEEKATYKKRIDVMRLTPTFYLAYAAERYFGSEEEITSARRTFISLCESVGVTAYAEHKYISTLKTEWGF
ncbi:MAG: DUF4838 domain-containing protein [Clostridia bacterium]|nr:DUF4838 domain-containing protein [Clostridia bacterium]